MTEPQETPSGSQEQGGGRQHFWERVQRFTGDRDEPGSFDAPPGSLAQLAFGPADDDGAPLYVASARNDGFDLFIGYRDRWLFHCEARHMRRLAWWVLWEWWAKGTWCGLKRRIYYAALTRALTPFREVAR